MFKMSIILRRTLAKQEVAERTPKRMKIRSICSSGLLPKHALIKWMSMDLLVLWHWFCKIIFISFKTSTGKKVLCFVELLNMFTYTKKITIYFMKGYSLTQTWHRVIKQNYRSSPDSLRLKILWAAYYLSLFQYGSCLKSIWNISVWNVR